MIADSNWGILNFLLCLAIMFSAQPTAMARSVENEQSTVGQYMVMLLFFSIEYDSFSLIIP